MKLNDKEEKNRSTMLGSHSIFICGREYISTKSELSLILFFETVSEGVRFLLSAISKRLSSTNTYPSKEP